MSLYLLNIAVRSAVSNINGLLPSTPELDTTKPGMAADFSEESNVQDNDMHQQSVPQHVIPVQPISYQKKENNIEPSYFSKHIERAIPEENSHEKNRLSENTILKMKGPSTRTALENVVVSHNVYDPLFESKTDSKIIPRENDTDGTITEILKANKRIPSKSQTINPSIQDQKINKLLPASIERMIPAQPAQVNKSRVQNNRMNAAAPKLIIGKIIVEMLPPKLPVPQKVITRVVQSSSKDHLSKSNKLIFGLGQL